MGNVRNVRGVSINTLAGNVFGRYDRNRDGKISIANESKVVNTLIERKTDWVRAIVRSPSTYFKYTEDSLDFSSFLSAADKDGDGQVTMKEVKAAIALFDKNKDGFLYREEVSELSNNFSETKLHRTMASSPADPGKGDLPDDSKIRNDNVDMHRSVFPRFSEPVLFSNSLVKTAWDNFHLGYFD